MISINLNDKIILRATKAQGFTCNRGRVCYFKKMDGILYKCTLAIGDPLENSFSIQERNIYQVIDNLTNAIIYTHDPSDAL